MIVDLARRYATTKPALLKFADGIQRHGNGGQTVRALCCLPAIVGQIGVRGGGLAYSTSGYVRWDKRGARPCGASARPRRASINMNRIGAALNGEAQRSADQIAVRVLRQPGRLRAKRQPDCQGFAARRSLHRRPRAVYDRYGRSTPTSCCRPPASSNRSICTRPTATATCNTTTPRSRHWARPKATGMSMRLLARAMGYDEPWLHESAEDAISRRAGCDACADNLFLDGITLERLQAEGTVPLHFPPGDGRAVRRWALPHALRQSRAVLRGHGADTGSTRCRRTCRQPSSRD